MLHGNAFRQRSKIEPGELPEKHGAIRLSLYLVVYFAGSINSGLNYLGYTYLLKRTPF